MLSSHTWEGLAARIARTRNLRLPTVEQDRPGLDGLDREHPVLVPTVLRESLPNRLLRRSRNGVQDVAVTSEWSAQHDETIVDERVHESRVLIPPVLLAQIPRPVPGPAALETYREEHSEHVTPRLANGDGGADPYGCRAERRRLRRLRPMAEQEPPWRAPFVGWRDLVVESPSKRGTASTCHSPRDSQGRALLTARCAPYLHLADGAIPLMNRPGRKPRVLIVGAGIAGLTLAASLEQFGVTPVVVEIGKASLSRGLALLLTSNVGLALRRVGLDRPVIDRGIVLERIVHIDAAGVPVEDDHDLDTSNKRYAPSLGITRDGLMSALASAAGAQIRYATTLTSVDWSAGDPEVMLSDGTHARFDLVVGADGIGSTVRRIIHPDVRPMYRSFCAWRTVIECSERDPVFRLSTTTGRFLGSFPVAPGMIYAFLLANSADIPELSAAERLARFKDLAAEFRADVSPLIQQQHDPSSVIFVPVQEVTTPSYYRGRVVLIGDAAHAFPPLLAQGAAMAIEDAVALAELLNGSSDIEQVLRAYESRRRPRVETIRAAVRHRGIARGMEGPVTPELLRQHPPVFSTSLKAFEELIGDPFAPDHAVA